MASCIGSGEILSFALFSFLSHPSENHMYHFPPSVFEIFIQQADIGLLRCMNAGTQESVDVPRHYVIRSTTPRYCTARIDDGRPCNPTACYFIRRCRDSPRNSG